jgi:DNA-binding LacI/PurR family transcriptional regulator
MLPTKTRRGLSKHDVRSRLREMAIQKGPSAKLPTQSELCVQIGTTPATLDDAMRELEAANIIYRRQGSGIYVSPKIGYKSVAIHFSHGSSEMSLSSPFWGMLMELLFRAALERSSAKEHEYSFHLLPFGITREASAGRRAFEELILSGNLDAILCVMPDEPLQGLIGNSGVPVVGYAVGPGIGRSVGFDYIRMFRIAADQLVRQGCRRIALMPARDVLRSLDLPLADLRREMGPSVTVHDLSTYVESPGQISEAQEMGWRTAIETFSSAADLRPDGLIVMDDMVTDGIMKALFRLGIRPGVDVKIASHANVGSPILRLWEDYLTIIESDPARLVDAMFETLDAVVSDSPPEPGMRQLPWSVRVNGKALFHSKA